ncbi:MAG: hypothetical protein M1812_005128 [Candelaria pacifica]|nr:MAG: hypothetical protein M1812_005128 [Candelaria pacifica]
MAARVTRGSVAKEAAFLADSGKENLPKQQLSSPPVTPPPKTKSTPSKKISKAKATSNKGVGEPALTPKTTSAKKAKTPATKVSSTPKAKKQTAKPETPATSHKRKRAAPLKVEEDINELPHNLGKIPMSSDEKADIEVEAKHEDDEDTKTPAKKRASSRKSGPPAVKRESPPVEKTLATDSANEDVPADESPTKKAKKAKANPYGLTPGETPYPDWPHPTPEECQEIVDLLSKVHGEVKAPATIPAPSTTVSGCGEVPSILDALIRTRLSAATSGGNSSRAFKGLVEKFGTLKKGIGKGSVDWDAVRRADVKDVFQAIKSGGLATTKSKDIKEILKLVYTENKARRNALMTAKDEKNTASEPRGAANETSQEKELEILRADSHVLSLDHLHNLSSPEALDTLMKYPGIGPKTASCVLLFCMQRPSFAVDTHVFRLCKWLNWVPPNKANRNTTYSHCEVRIPDGLKYPLHQLFIKHGKTCKRCKAGTGEGSEGWENGCPIEVLVKRTKKRDGKGGEGGKKRGGKGKKGVVSEEEEDEEEGEEEDELSDPPSDIDDDEDNE